MVLSAIQLSMWFTSLLRLMDTFLRISFLWWRFKMEFILALIPPYEYVLTKIKEPPKGIILAIVDIFFVTIHFLVLFFGYFLALPFLGIKKIYSFVLSFQFSDFLSRSPTSKRYTIFRDDGITLHTSPGDFSKLYSCAFAARASGTDAVAFDVDSFDVAMDNCASRTMTFCKEDFISEIVPPDINHITGAGGAVAVKGMGDVEYFVTDDKGARHSLIIRDALYVPSVPFRLIAINQYAQQLEGTPMSEGTGIFSFGWHSKFRWNNQQFCKTIIHRENIDIPVMEVNNGNGTYSKFHKSFSKFFDTKNDCSVAFRCTSVHDQRPDAPLLPPEDNTILSQICCF